MATIRYTIPKTIVISPVQMFPPTLVVIATIPEIIRNIPAIKTNAAATILKKLGLKINPIPRIIAKIPNVNSTIPMAIFSSNVVKPAVIRPTPKNRTARPVNTLKGTTPKTGKAIIINPRTIRINALPFFRSIINHLKFVFYHPN